MHVNISQNKVHFWVRCAFTQEWTLFSDNVVLLPCYPKVTHQVWVNFWVIQMVIHVHIPKLHINELFLLIKNFICRQLALSSLLWASFIGANHVLGAIVILEQSYSRHKILCITHSILLLIVYRNQSSYVFNNSVNHVE